PLDQPFDPFLIAHPSSPQMTRVDAFLRKLTNPCHNSMIVNGFLCSDPGVGDSALHADIVRMINSAITSQARTPTQCGNTVQSPYPP
ncbi:MAG: hypothetical protein KA271_07100, partial [Propionivibrio sp.]|nr:hypothetical protein [Propionivibrio sp.]